MEKGNLDLEAFASTVNDLSDQLPKSRGACFDIGSWGGCGVDCAEFCRGGCDVPEEINSDDVIEEHGIDDGVSILEFYGCFDDAVKELTNNG